MALDIAKLKLIRDTAEQMSGMSHADLNLVLYEAGLGHLPNHWYGDDYNGPPSQEDRRQIAVDILRDVSVTEIGEISVALQQLYDLPHVDLKPSEPSIVRLFASHLDAQMKLVREVADVLSTYCISLFVAHNDIPVDDEWHNAIESHLQSVDGGVVFLHPGFNKSEWCDQEVGWLLGRGTPVFTLKFADQHPYGPLGKRQALVVQPHGYSQHCCWTRGGLD